MVGMQHVVLVPGFMGFGNFGDLHYFLGAREALQRAFTEGGATVEVTEVDTNPTGSIRQRAAAVRETVARIGTGESVHLVGHSTGGIDARLAAAPVATLPGDPAEDAIRSLVTISTPHRGTPLADLLGSAFGKPLLALLAGLAFRILRRRRRSLQFVLKLGRLVTRVDDLFGQRDTVLDEIYRDLLSDFSEERQEAIAGFMEAIASDQSLVFQLTTAGCDVFNACTATPEVPYGSVLTKSPTPRVAHLVRRNLYAASSHAVYALLYAAARRTGGSQDAVARHVNDVVDARDRPIDPRDNDGIVPTRSQVWGEIVDVVDADHLDVVGHFGRDASDPTSTGSSSVDWLPSGSSFDQARFEEMWARIARFQLRAAKA